MQEVVNLLYTNDVGPARLLYWNSNLLVWSQAQPCARPPPPTITYTYQSELESLSSRVQEIIEENSKLHTELRKSLEAQLQSSMGQGGEASSGVGGVSTVIVGGLQHQLDLLSKERDSYVELWRQTTSELETLQKSEQVWYDTCALSDKKK